MDLLASLDEQAILAVLREHPKLSDAAAAASHAPRWFDGTTSAEKPDSQSSEGSKRLARSAKRPAQRTPDNTFKHGSERFAGTVRGRLDPSVHMPRRLCPSCGSLEANCRCA